MKIQVFYPDPRWFSRVEEIRSHVHPEIPSSSYISLVRYQVFSIDVPDKVPVQLTFDF